MIEATKDNKIYMYYFAGQSNCGGIGQSSELTGDDIKYRDFSNTLIRYFNDYNVATGTIESLKIGINSKPGYFDNGYFGFEHSFLWKQARHKNRNICLVKLGIGGIGLDPLFNPDWHPDTVNSLYDGFINHANITKAYFEGLGYTVIPKVLVWVQGEQDSKNSTATTNYQANQTSIFNAFRTDIDANLTIVDIKITTQIDPVYTNWAAINTAKDNVAGSLANIIQVDFSDLDLLPDNVHYNTKSNITGGERIFELIKDI